MNKRYIAIVIALTSAAHLIVADAVKLGRVSKEDTVMHLSNIDLQRAYQDAMRDYIAMEYAEAKARLAYDKCKFQHRLSQDKDACLEFRMKYDEVGPDLKESARYFDMTAKEKDRRKIYQGIAPGRSFNVIRIIGEEKWNEDQADLYRLEKDLHQKTNEELVEKQNKIRQKRDNIREQGKEGTMPELAGYTGAYSRMATLKLLAIERELADYRRKK